MQWSIYKVVAYLGLVILFGITVLYGLKRKKLSKALKVFSIYLLCMLISDLISKYLFLVQQNNLSVLHIFNYAEWILLSTFYISFYEKRKRPRVWTLSFFVFIFLFLGSIFLYGIEEYNVIGYFALKIFIIAMSIREIYLYQFGEETHYYFINIGLLISAAVNLVIFTFGNKLSDFSPEVQSGLWVFNAIVFIITLSLFAYELILVTKWKKSL